MHIVVAGLVETLNPQNDCHSVQTQAQLDESQLYSPSVAHQMV